MEGHWYAWLPVLPRALEVRYRFSLVFTFSFFYIMFVKTMHKKTYLLGGMETVLNKWIFIRTISNQHKYVIYHQLKQGQEKLFRWNSWGWKQKKILRKTCSHPCHKGRSIILTITVWARNTSIFRWWSHLHKRVCVSDRQTDRPTDRPFRLEMFKGWMLKALSWKLKVAGWRLIK